MKLGFHIAVRFLKSNIGQTILIVMGIAIGVSVQIFIGSLIQGLQKSLIEKTIGDSAHITILPGEDEEEIEEYDALYKKILGADDRIESISFAADYPAFFELDDESKSVLVR